MKLLCAEYGLQTEMTISVVGDNALLRNNNDFYFPAFTQELYCVPQLILRACKLGKGFSERFASRYYNEVGVGIRFYAATLEQTLKKQGLPVGLASSFDDSAAQSELVEYNGEKVNYHLSVNEKLVFDGNSWDLPISMNRFVSMVSGYYMIKIGDFFYCGNPFRYNGLEIGDRLQMWLNDRRLLDFYIK